MSLASVLARQRQTDVGETPTEIVKPRPDYRVSGRSGSLRRIVLLSCFGNRRGSRKDVKTIFGDRDVQRRSRPHPSVTGCNHRVVVQSNDAHTCRN